jgi:RHS repeat-associated protein
MTAATATGAPGFLYDALGRRVQVAQAGVSTNYVYDRLNGVEEQNGSGQVIGDMLGGALDDWFTRTDSSGTNTMLRDGTNSTAGLVNSGGSLATQFTYEPFGRTTFSGSGSTNLYRFTGREIDASGLYFMRARYYNPVLQRFLSPDPMGFAGGSMNLYSYAGNSPTNLIDPLGLVGGASGCGGGGGSGVSAAWQEMIKKHGINPGGMNPNGSGGTGSGGPLGWMSGGAMTPVEVEGEGYPGLVFSQTGAGGQVFMVGGPAAGEIAVFGGSPNIGGGVLSGLPIGFQLAQSAQQVPKAAPVPRWQPSPGATPPPDLLPQISACSELACMAYGFGLGKVAGELMSGGAELMEVPPAQAEQGGHVMEGFVDFNTELICELVCGP